MVTIPKCDHNNLVRQLIIFPQRRFYMSNKNSFELLKNTVSLAHNPALPMTAMGLNHIQLH